MSRRRRVLEAAYVVFGDRGITVSTLDDVAEQADLARSEIDSLFVDKDELVLALLEEHVMYRLASAAECFVAAPGREQALADVGQLLLEAVHVDSTAHRLLAENYVLTSRDPHRHAAMAARRREAHDAVARVLVRLQEMTGLRLVLTPDQTAVVLLALSNGLGMEAGLNPESVPTELLGRLLTRLVVDL